MLAVALLRGPCSKHLLKQANLLSHLEAVLADAQLPGSGLAAAAGDRRQHWALLLHFLHVRDSCLGPCARVFCLSYVIHLHCVHTCACLPMHCCCMLWAKPLIVLLLLRARYTNKVVAKVPFQPPALMRKMVHRGLDDPEVDDCALVSHTAPALDSDSQPAVALCCTLRCSRPVYPITTHYVPSAASSAF